MNKDSNRKRTKCRILDRCILVLMDSLTNRWLSALGLATLCFGIFLFVLRLPVRTISIFFVIGIPLILLWLYVDENSRRQKKMATLFTQPCICSICKHDRAGICLKQKCACCIVMKGSNAVGHSINSINDRRDGRGEK
jgi:Flp pilus assembly protein TadB